MLLNHHLRFQGVPLFLAAEEGFAFLCTFALRLLHEALGGIHHDHLPDRFAGTKCHLVRQDELTRAHQGIFDTSLGA